MTNIEFLITYRRTNNTDIRQVLLELLAKVLQDNLNEIELQVVDQMIRLEHERVGIESISDNGETSNHVLLCFSLELPDEVEQVGMVVDDFASLLPESSPIFHAVKFEDPILQEELLSWSKEIFTLEMKLRRVLTMIYLHAHQGSDPYNLLTDETVQPMSREKLQTAQMKAAVENQFFHLTFGQYVGLNQRPEPKQMSALLEVIRDSATYDAFRSEIQREPIEHEDDAVLLAGLKERMDAIETMRNCIAHNRRPSKRVVENYDNARPLVDKMLNEYLARWELGRESTPSPPIQPQ